MALKVLFTLGLCLSVLASAIGPSHGLFGFRRGWPWSDPQDRVVGPPEAGICAASVIPHGYKCQEIDVRIKPLYIYKYVCIYFINLFFFKCCWLGCNWRWLYTECAKNSGGSEQGWFWCQGPEKTTCFASAWCSCGNYISHIYMYMRYLYLYPNTRFSSFFTFPFSTTW